MLRVCCWQILFAFALFLHRNGQCAPAGPPGVASTYMDWVLKSSFQNESAVKQLDPASVPDFETEFEDKVRLFGKVKGNAKYTNGKLYGFSKAQRLGECPGPATMAATNFINCTLSLEDMKIEYDGRVKYGKMPTVSVSAKGNVSRTLLNISVESYEKMRIPTIKFFTFLPVEVNATFSGLGPFNKYLKILEEDFKRQTASIISDSIRDRLRNALDSAVSKVKFPWFSR